MATQLRLVEAPPEASVPVARARRADGAVARPGPAVARARRARAVNGSTRRPAHWGEWRLDARTRQVGRAGVAAARAALQRAIDAESLPRAS